MQQASRKAEPGDYKHVVSDNYVGMKSSKEVANVGVAVHVQQRLNGPHGTLVHDIPTNRVQKLLITGSRARLLHGARSIPLTNR